MGGGHPGIAMAPKPHSFLLIYFSSKVISLVLGVPKMKIVQWKQKVLQLSLRNRNSDVYTTRSNKDKAAMHLFV